MTGDQLDLIPDEPGPWAGWVVPLGYVPHSIARCRGCSRPILWCETPRGKRSPHDRDGVSHFATCPEAPSFRSWAGR